MSIFLFCFVDCFFYCFFIVLLCYYVVFNKHLFSGRENVFKSYELSAWMV